MASSAVMSQPTVAFHPLRIVIAAAGGVIAGFLVAAIVLAWEHSRVPAPVVLAPLFQGLMLGLVLSYLFAVLRLPSSKLGFLIGLISGAVSIAAVHLGHYVTDVNAYRVQAPRLAAEFTRAAGPEAGAAYLATVNADPYQAYDDFEIFPATRRRGFFGHLHLRARYGAAIKRIELTGSAMWVLWAIEALLVMGLAAAMSLPVVDAQPAPTGSSPSVPSAPATDRD